MSLSSELPTAPQATAYEHLGANQLTHLGFMALSANSLPQVVSLHDATYRLINSSGDHLSPEGRRREEQFRCSFLDPAVRRRRQAMALLIAEAGSANTKSPDGVAAIDYLASQYSGECQSVSEVAQQFRQLVVQAHNDRTERSVQKGNEALQAEAEPLFVQLSLPDRRADTYFGRLGGFALGRHLRSELYRPEALLTDGQGSLRRVPHRMVPLGLWVKASQ